MAPSQSTSQANRQQPGQPRDGIALALSGGGYRAMLFHTGALIRLNELGLLRQLKRVSSVSGGSISAGYLGFVWKRLRWDTNDVAANFADEYVAGICGSPAGRSIISAV